MKIVNLEGGDYHIHTSTFSDGLNSIDEMVKFAGEIGLKEIAITDHSQAKNNIFPKIHGFSVGNGRYNLKNWRNVYNDVNVIFGVEGDLLNEKGDVCFDIQKQESEFSILSMHGDVYYSDPKTVTDGLIKAIERYYNKIKFIAHPCSKSSFDSNIDIKRLVKKANQYDVPLEFNGKAFADGRMDMDKLEYVLQSAKYVYVNSDAHTLWALREYRKICIEYLKEKKYI